MWKLMLIALVVHNNLHRRGMHVDPKCPFCDAIETTSKMVLQCGWTRLVWFEILSIHTDNLITQLIHLWLEDLYFGWQILMWERLRHWSHYGYICWLIWKEIYRTTFDNTKPALNKVIEAWLRELVSRTHKLARHLHKCHGKGDDEIGLPGARNHQD